MRLGAGPRQLIRDRDGAYSEACISSDRHRRHRRASLGKMDMLRG